MNGTAPDLRNRPLRDAERWLAWVRLGAVPFAIFQVALSSGYPGGYRRDAWIVTAVLALGAAALLLATRRVASRLLALCALAFDTGIVSAYVLIYSFEQVDATAELVPQAFRLLRACLGDRALCP